MNRRAAIALVSAAVLLAAAGGAAGYVHWFGNRPLHPGVDLYTLHPGATARDLSRELYRRGAVPDAYTLVLWAYLRGDTRRLKAGEYRFRDGINARELLAQVTRGDVVSYAFTIIEGWSFAQLRTALGEIPKLRHTLSGASDDEVMARLGHAGQHPEGRFLPETYRYIAGMSDLDVLARAYRHMQRALEEEWAQRAPELPLAAPYDALILASIVEKETALADERGRIAGVFVNRLRRGMRLQTDPTVIYGMGADFDGNLRAKDLRTDTPYNTYTRAGLPPTPIALPGRASLHAALNPAATKALYFVARGDGSHVFSETLSEHNAAVITYQLKGRRRPFSSFTPDEAGKPASPASGSKENGA
jgi:UPF0755 protein